MEFHGGGGFRGDDYIYEYLTDLLSFTISDTVSNDVINSLNMSTKEKTEQKQHDETLNALNNQGEQNQQFYNSVLSNQFNESQPGDTLNSMGGGFRDSVDDSSYVGLFSTVVSKFAAIINGDYSSVEEIHIPLPNSDKYITLKSDLLSSFIQNTFIYDFLQIFWTYLFGMYIFKYSYSLIKAIKTGSILSGYSWENEAITSSML